MQAVWLSVAMVFSGLLFGCSDAGRDQVPPSTGIAKVFYMRRDVSTGRFEPYVLHDVRGYPTTGHMCILYT